MQLLKISLFLFLCLSLLDAQNVTDLGDIRVQSDGPAAVAVDIASSDAKVRNLAAMAFRTHGGYDVMEAGTFTFNFVPAGANAVRLQISSGRPRQLQLDQLVQGSSWVDATLKAADLAVLKTTNSPGFFSGKLAFVSDRTGTKEVYISDVFFIQPRKITGGGSRAVTPRWDPQGQRILYTTYFKTGFPDIYMLTFSGQGIRRTPFATYKGTNQGGTFSPDGRRVAMILSSAGNPELYVSGSDGKNPKRLTSNRSVEATPTWSPDGRQLAFSSDQAGGPQLYRIPVNGGVMRRIPTNISGYCSEPAWNPKDKNQIIFTAAVRGGFQLALYDFSKGKSEWITSGGGSASEASWAADGRHVFYTYSDSRGNTEIRIIDTLSKDSASLSRQIGNARQASFAK